MLQSRLKDMHKFAASYGSAMEVAQFSCACSVDLLAVKPLSFQKTKTRDKRQDRICSLHYMKWMMLQCTSMTGKEQTDD